MDGYVSTTVGLGKEGGVEGVRAHKTKQRSNGCSPGCDLLNAWSPPRSWMRVRMPSTCQRQFGEGICWICKQQISKHTSSSFGFTYIGEQERCDGDQEDVSMLFARNSHIVRK